MHAGGASVKPPEIPRNRPLDMSVLGAVLGFRVSATAVQKNTEMVGGLLPEDPCKAIDSQKRQQESELMVVEIDGTMTPQILEKEGVTGRESLKLKTEYKCGFERSLTNM